MGSKYLYRVKFVLLSVLVRVVRPITTNRNGIWIMNLKM